MYIRSAWKDREAFRRLMSLDSRSSSSRSESIERSGSRYAPPLAARPRAPAAAAAAGQSSSASSAPPSDDSDTVRVSSCWMFRLISPMSVFSVVDAIRRTMSRSFLSSFTKMLRFACVKGIQMDPNRGATWRAARGGGGRGRRAIGGVSLSLLCFLPPRAYGDGGPSWGRTCFWSFIASAASSRVLLGTSITMATTFLRRPPKLNCL